MNVVLRGGDDLEPFLNTENVIGASLEYSARTSQALVLNNLRNPNATQGLISKSTIESPNELTIVTDKGTYKGKSFILDNLRMVKPNYKDVSGINISWEETYDLVYFTDAIINGMHYESLTNSFMRGALNDHQIQAINGCSGLSIAVDPSGTHDLFSAIHELKFKVDRAVTVTCDGEPVQPNEDGSYSFSRVMMDVPRYREDYEKAIGSRMDYLEVEFRHGGDGTFIFTGGDYSWETVSMEAIADVFRQTFNNVQLTNHGTYSIIRINGDTVDKRIPYFGGECWDSVTLRSNNGEYVAPGTFTTSGLLPIINKAT